MGEAGTGGKRELMATVVIVLLLTLVGAGVGFAVGTLLAPGETAKAAGEPAAGDTDTAAPSETAEHQPEGEGNAAGEADATQTAEEENVEEDILPKDLAVIPFPAVLTTLAEPKGKWIRVEGSILAKQGGEKSPELLAEESGERILAYLRTVRLDQLESPSGLLGLRDDLNETVRTLSDGHVHGVLIHGLVIE